MVFSLHSKLTERILDDISFENYFPKNEYYHYLPLLGSELINLLYITAEMMPLETTTPIEPRKRIFFIRRFLAIFSISSIGGQPKAKDPVCIPVDLIY